LAATRDERFMAEAVKLGRLRKGRTSPNPAVGAVITRGDKIVAKGFHERAGSPHAEIMALREAGGAARGAALYVTLEPCVFKGKTPPCVPEIVKAGLRRVVIGTLDPDRRSSGRGAAALAKAGTRVAVGVRERECRHLIEDFAKFATAGRPWVTVKFAASLDGKIATRTGESAWISGAPARRRAHRLRWEHAAVAVGAGTLKADDPRLTVRIRGCGLSDGPTRVVVSSRARIPSGARIFEDLPRPSVWLACTERADRRAIARLTRRGVEIIMCTEEEGRISLDSLLEGLAARDINSLLVEGGEELLGGFLDRGLVDRVVACIAPKIIGGAGAKAAVGGRGTARMADVEALQEVKRRWVGGDAWIDGYLTDVDDLFLNVPRAADVVS
jgi:diaminohydroxyphosphoribosylaminopyrimidine deaminase/5-amino-6-(5-phosphoribosylamino)uracil reductase